MWEQFRRAFAGVAMVGAMSVPALAGGPAPGCYERDYTNAHLAKYPAQIVDRIVLQIYQEGGTTVADMWVRMANQGHVARSGHGGQRFLQLLTCGAGSGGNTCYVECDGGQLQVTRQNSNSLTFRTKYLILNTVPDCGGVVDLAEIPNRPVSYRLNRVSDAVCIKEN